MMTKRIQLLLLLVLFLLALSGIRMLYLSLFAIPEHPKAINGVLDLRDLPLSQSHPITLDGEWAFYPNALLTPEEALAMDSLPQPNYIPVPGIWNAYLAKEESEDSKSSYYYGTYRLKVLLNDEDNHLYAMRLSRVLSAFKVIVNGHTIVERGHPAESVERFQAYNPPATVSFIAENAVLDILVQVAHYDYGSGGGINNSIKFGTDAAMDKQSSLSVSMQIVVCVMLLVHALYAAILYLFKTRHKGILYFVFFLLSTILSILVDDDKLLVSWTSISYIWNAKLILMAYTGISAFMMLFAMNLFPNYNLSRALRIIAALCGIYVLFVLTMPVQYVMYTAYWILLLLFIPACIVTIIIMRNIILGENDAVFFLLSAAAIVSNMFWSAFKSWGLLPNTYYPIDILLAVILFAAFWLKRFLRTNEQNAKLANSLLMADKMKDDFLANTSHELRNPLHAMINIARSVQESHSAASNANHPRDLELLITIGRRMSHLLTDLLDLTRLKEHRIRLQPDNIQLQPIATSVFDMLRFMTEGKPIDFKLDIPKSLPAVYADENRLVQILSNLVHNAVKYTNEGSITIRASVEGGDARIVVSDTGIGIDSETIDKIFLPYEQGDSSITSRGGGIGLGLNICKQLVELQGSKLSVASVPGQGSAFSFTMPLARKSEEPAEPSAPLTGENSGTYAAAKETAAGAETMASEVADPAAETLPRILAVDDDPVNLKVLQILLPSDRFHLVTATSGKEAIELLDRGFYQLVITDVMMPEMSGYELTAIIRERFSLSELPILLLTARTQPDDIAAGFKAGASDYVIKPVDALELRSRVSALTDLQQSIADRLRLEAAWLQAQIQPHFLFNTLNSISALIDIDVDRMRNLLHMFGEYLNKSFNFNNADHVVPLAHELELVRSYLYIEKERFDERLNVIWEADEQQTLDLPPLSIQPLVENALIHGILKRSRGGTVCIRIVYNDDFTEVSIIDDGVGMEKEKLQSLLMKRTSESGGIGLLNIDRRLKQLYGEGLLVVSEPHEGTSVTFRIPKRCDRVLKKNGRQQ
ncbi:sensor histidine kinase YesM [Paenibacillus harenae]|uniref:histidine kinase n=2 Tax=Paenibacillus harenae TaxID=306543 RepID=A0ABT9TUT6_PAEHA|nr:sensor histidine kinase YesM [Paenibacillus harenae]